MAVFKDNCATYILKWNLKKLKSQLQQIFDT